jgi:Zn-dependent peptidase ImmA (M78 family)
MIKRIKVGCFTYDIVVAQVRASDNHGETDRSNKEIFLSDCGNIEVVKETLLHELLHALLEDAQEFGIFADDNHEERLIRLLSPKLMSVMLDNPKLVEYLWKK